MKQRLILSLMSFIMVFILFAALSFAWFTLSDEARGKEGEFVVYDENVNINISYWREEDWTNEELKFASLGLKKPGDIIYLKFSFTRKNDELTKVTSFKFSNIIDTVANNLYCDGVNVYTIDLKGNRVNLHQLDTNNEIKDANGNVWLKYNPISKNLSLDYYKITDVLRVYVSDSLENPNNVNLNDLGEGQLISKDIQVEKEFNENGIVNVFLAIELNQAEIEKDIASNYYRYQYFKVVGIDAVVE